MNSLPSLSCSLSIAHAQWHFASGQGYTSVTRGLYLAWCGGWQAVAWQELQTSCSWCQSGPLALSLHLLFKFKSLISLFIYCCITVVLNPTFRLFDLLGLYPWRCKVWPPKHCNAIQPQQTKMNFDNTMHCSIIVFWYLETAKIIYINSQIHA